jgi:WD40 repeat protein
VNSFRRPALGRLAALALAASVAAALMPAGPAGASTAKVWSETINSHTYDAGGTGGTAVAVSPDGSTVYAAGLSTESVCCGIGDLAAYSSLTGATLWRTRYSPGKAWDSGFSSIAVSPNGSAVFVTGYSGVSGTSEGLEPLIVAYDAATGAKLWQVRGAQAVRGPVTVSPDSSTVYGTSAAGSGQTVAYNAATGATLWNHHTGGTGLALSAGGTTLYVTGSAPRYGADGVIDALNTATGATIWSAHYGSSAELTSLALSADGSTLFAGGTIKNTATGHGRVLVTAAYSTSSGTQLWATQTGDKVGYSRLAGLAASPDGSAVIVSETIWPRKATGHWATVGLNPATGALLWTRTLWGSRATGAQNTASAVTVSGSTAYVTGTLWGSGAKGDEYFATVGYTAATGATVFSADYRGHENDAAHAIAASPDGSMVFVTGGRGYPTGTPEGGRLVMTTVGYSI